MAWAVFGPRCTRIVRAVGESCSCTTAPTWWIALDTKLSGLLRKAHFLSNIGLLSEIAAEPLEMDFPRNHLGGRSRHHCHERQSIAEERARLPEPLQLLVPIARREDRQRISVCSHGGKRATSMTKSVPPLRLLKLRR
jgi:hypothetical protein